MPEVYHSVVLLSKGAPIEHGRLNTTWERDAAEPEVNGFPHFTNAKGSLHLFRTAEGLWEIAPEIDAGKAFAVARTAAAHPNTIKPGEWSLPKGGGWAKASGFKVSTEGPNTEDRPFDVNVDLGADFFIRVRTTKVVWFRDPATGEVMHSGAKAAGVSKKPGKRYCPLCEHSFSANNFVSQHVRNLHTPPAPTAPTVTPDGEGGVTLDWSIEGWAVAAEPCSFAVQFSTDSGENWTTGVEDTLTNEPRAHIASLSAEQTYTFRVAAHSIAALGNYSESSTPLNPYQLGVKGAPLLSAASMPPLAQSTADETISMSDLVGEQPMSPDVVVPPPLGMSAADMPRKLGGKSKRDDGEAGGSGSSHAKRATADLVWSIEELVRTAQEAEAEGEDNVHALASLFHPSKRAKARSREEVFLEDLLSSLDGDAPMGDGSGAEPTPAEQLAMDGPAFRSGRQIPIDCLQESSHHRLLARLHGSGKLPTHLADDPEISKTLSKHQTNGGAEPLPLHVHSEAIKHEGYRLAKLRHALAAAPAYARNFLLTPEVMKILGRAEWNRELALILTYAPADAAATAASEDSACRRAKTAQMFALPPPDGAAAATFTLPPPKAQKTAKPGSGGFAAPSAAVWLLLGTLALAASWPVLASAGFLSALAPPPPSPTPTPGPLQRLCFWCSAPPTPACHWDKSGCVPSNAATSSCTLDWTQLPSLTCAAQ